jgi:hypothetical protein
VLCKLAIDDSHVLRLRFVPAIHSISLVDIPATQRRYAPGAPISRRYEVVVHLHVFMARGHASPDVSFDKQAAPIEFEVRISFSEQPFGFASRISIWLTTSFLSRLSTRPITPEMRFRPSASRANCLTPALVLSSKTGILRLFSDDAPIGINPALRLQSQQGGIHRTFIQLQYVFAHLLDAACDAEPM